jgi:hypothetical protein
MKPAIEIELKQAYQASFEKTDSFIVLNGSAINNDVIEQIKKIQADMESNRISNGYAELFSYLIEAGELIDHTDEFRNVLLFAKMQFAMYQKIRDAIYCVPGIL